MSGIITKQNAKDKAFISGSHKSRTLSTATASRSAESFASSVTTSTLATPAVINPDSVNVQALNNIKRAFTLQAPKSK